MDIAGLYSGNPEGSYQGNHQQWQSSGNKRLSLPGEGSMGMLPVNSHPPVKKIKTVDANRITNFFAGVNIQSRNVKSSGDAQRSPVLDIRLLDKIQELVKQYLLKKYDGTPTADNTLGRPRHGAQHQCRTVLWALILLQMRRNMGEQIANNFSEKMIQALVITCILHDSGRKGDGIDQPKWEQASANHAREAVRAITGDDRLADLCANAIIFKDQPELFNSVASPEERLFRSLLRDADVFEVVRTRNDFQLEYLDIFREYTGDQERKALSRLAIDVRDIISAQHDLVSAVTISAPDGQGRKTVSESLPGNYSEPFKRQFEHADNALMEQFRHLRQCKPALFTLLLQNSLVDESLPVNEPDNAAFTLKRLVKLSEPKGMCQGPEVGLSRDLVTGEKWYVKEPVNEAAARNEQLMCDIARALGLDTPECRLHSEAGKVYFLSKWRDGLSSGATGLKALSGAQKAQLMVVMSVLGNLDGIGAGWNNTMVDAQGQPVAIDWGEAGLYSSISDDVQRKRRGVFGATPYELEVFRAPKTPMAVAFLKQFHPDWHPRAIERAADLFSDVTDHDLHRAARALLLQSGDPLASLVEQSDLEKAFERNVLRQIIAERIAWLAIRYPDAAEQQRLTPAEWRAIQAAGIQGFCRQIPASEVERGQVRFYQQKISNDQTETLACMRLTPGVARRLAGLFSIANGAQHLREELDFYRNTVGGREMTDEVRCDLIRLKQQYVNLKGVVHNEQWQFISDSDQEAVPAQVPAESVESQLDLVITRLEQFIKQQNGVRLPWQSLPALTFAARCLPDRVVPVAMADSRIDGAELSNGFARRAGQQYPLVPDAITSSAYHFERIMANGVRARLNPGHLPDAKSMERTLTLSLSGDDLETGTALLQALEQLGVDIHRPSWQELQGQYLDQLAACSGCASVMADQEVDAALPLAERNQQKIQFLRERSYLEATDSPRWEHHCRMLNGQLIFYRPPFPWGGKKTHENGYCAVHDLSYLQDEWRDIPAVLDQMIHSGGSLDSYNERSRKGIQPVGSHLLCQNIQQGAGPLVFTRLCRKGIQKKRGLLITGADTLARLDALVLSDNRLRHQSGPFPYTAPYARKYFQRQAASPDVCQELADNPNNIVNLSGGLSLLDELEHIQVSTDSERKRIIDTLGKHVTKWWPNGRSLDDLVTFTHDYETMSTRGPFAGLVKAIGPAQLERFIQANPGFDQGRMYDWRGFVIECCRFTECDFSGLNLRMTDFKQCQFENCWFDGAELDFDLIKTSSFNYTQDDNNHARMEKSLEACYLACIRKAIPDKSYKNLGIGRLDYLPIFKNYQQLGLHRLPSSVLTAYRFLIYSVLDSGSKGVQQYRFPEETYMQMFEYFSKNEWGNNDCDLLLKITDPVSAERFLKLNGEMMERSLRVNRKDIRFDGIHFQGQDFRGMDLSDYSLSGACFKDCQFNEQQLGIINITDLEFINCQPEWLNDFAKVEKFTKALLSHQVAPHPDGLPGNIQAFIQSQPSIPIFDKESTEIASNLASCIKTGRKFWPTLKKEAENKGWSIRCNPVDFMSHCRKYVILDNNQQTRIIFVVYCYSSDITILSEISSHWLNSILPHTDTIPITINQKAEEEIRGIMDEETYNRLFLHRTMNTNLYFPIRRLDRGWNGTEAIEYVKSEFKKWYQKTESEAPETLKKFTKGEFKNTETGIRINQFFDMSFNFESELFKLYSLCRNWDTDQGYSNPYLEWRRRMAKN